MIFALRVKTDLFIYGFRTPEPRNIIRSSRRLLTHNHRERPQAP